MGFHLYLSFSICSANLGTQSLSRFKSYKPIDFFTPASPFFTNMVLRTDDTRVVDERDSHFIREVRDPDALFAYISCMGENLSPQIAQHGLTRWP